MCGRGRHLLALRIAEAEGQKISRWRHVGALDAREHEDGPQDGGFQWGWAGQPGHGLLVLIDEVGLFLSQGLGEEGQQVGDAEAIPAHQPLRRGQRGCSNAPATPPSSRLWR